MVKKLNCLEDLKIINEIKLTPKNLQLIENEDIPLKINIPNSDIDTKKYTFHEILYGEKFLDSSSDPNYFLNTDER